MRVVPSRRKHERAEWPDTPALDRLGDRICILGPSGSGKSTLAVSIARKRGLTAIHLDQLHHQPHTDWHPRPPEAFLALHDAAILGERWVIDGNYSRCLPQRLRRATGVILLDVPTATSLLRYLRRCWFDTVRHGTLEGARDRVGWAMIRHIAGATRTYRRRYAALFETLSLPRVKLATAREMTRFYRAEGLDRFGAP